MPSSDILSPSHPIDAVDKIIKDIQSSNYISCRNALSRLEKISCQEEIDNTNALSILKGNEVEQEVDTIILSIVSGDSHPEICRERAAIALKSLLHRSFEGKRSCTSELEGTIDYAFQFFRNFCPIFKKRFATQSQIDVARPKPVEEVEEIRLLLVRIMSTVIEFIASSREHYKTIECLKSKKVVCAVSSLSHALSMNSLRDPYPDLTRESCILLKTMCPLFSNTMQMHVEALLVPLIGKSLAQDVETSTSGEDELESIENQTSFLNLNTSTQSLLRHRHSKTRSLAIETAVSVICCYNKETSNDYSVINSMVMTRLSFQVIPNLEGIGPYDKSSSVRIIFSNAICSLLTLAIDNCGVSVSSSTNFASRSIDELPKQTISVVSKLLVLHLLCVSDESESVSSKTTEYGIHIGQDATLSCPILIAQFASDIINIFLLNISSARTSLEHKKRYLDALGAAIQHFNRDNGSESRLKDHTHGIVRVLCDSFSRGVEGTFRSTMLCVKALGANKAFRTSALTLVLGAMRGDHEEDCIVSRNLQKYDGNDLIIVSSPSQCSSVFNFLSGLLRGALLVHDEDHSTLWSEVQEITVTLVDASSIIEYIHHPCGISAYALIDLLHVLVDVIKDIIGANKTKVSTIDPVIPRVLFCCVHLLGCQVDPDIKLCAKNIITSLSEGKYGNPTKYDPQWNVLDLNFQAVYDLTTSNMDLERIKSWVYGDPELLAFDALMRNSHGSVVGANFASIGKMFEAHLSTSVDSSKMCFRTKLFVMALLESIISDEMLAKNQFQSFVEHLICNVISPNLAWQSSSAASSLRKLSMAVLFTLAHRGAMTAKIICTCAPVMFPVVKSNLSDDDSSIRELAVATLGKCFEIMPRVLGEVAVNRLYPDLINLLDDDNESVRMSACDTLKHFLLCAPIGNFQGAAIECIVENLFLHMDDQNNELQKKVFEVLVTAMTVNPGLVVKNAKLCLLSHRSSKYCNMLLEQNL